jgi:hypothetical protein
MIENFADKCATIYGNTMKKYEKDIAYFTGKANIKVNDRVVTKGTTDKEVDAR